MALCLQCFLTTFTILTSPLTPATPQPPNTTTTQPLTKVLRLDHTVRNHAYRSLMSHHHRTGQPVPVHLPNSLSSISASTAVYRTGSLRRHGTAIREFELRPGVVVRPHARRLVVVAERVGGEWCLVYERFRNMLGFHLVSDVVGIMAFGRVKGCHEVSQVEMFAEEKPIVVDFSKLVHASTLKRGLLCAAFWPNGTTTLFPPGPSPTTCFTRCSGHFGLVARPLIPQQPGTVSSNDRHPNAMKKKKEREVLGSFKDGLVIVGASVFTLAILGVVAVLFVRSGEKRRLKAMERKTRDEEALQVSVVGFVRAPSASASRTLPSLEDEHM